METDLVPRGTSRFEADRAATDKGDGFSLGLPDALGPAAATLIAMHQNPLPMTPISQWFILHVVVVFKVPFRRARSLS